MQSQAVISIKKRQIPIMDLLIDLTQMTNKLHQFILLLGIVELAECVINVSKGCGIFRIRHSRDRFFVESDRVTVSALRGADLSKPGESAIVIGTLFDRGKISFLCSASIPSQEDLFAKLILAPCNILGRHVRLYRRAHRTSHELDSPLRI